MERSGQLRVFGPRWVRELPTETAARADRALRFAERAHGSQTRPAGEPYVEHLREAIAVLVDGVGAMEPNLLAAAALHHVVEDTDVTIDGVRAEFGDTVASAVAWVTKAPGEDKETHLARLADARATLVATDRRSSVSYRRFRR